MAALMWTDYRLETLGLSARVIELLKKYEDIHSVPELVKILRITPDARLDVDISGATILGYGSADEIREALGRAGMPMAPQTEKERR